VRTSTWRDGPAYETYDKGKWTTLAYLLTLPQFAFQSLSTWAETYDKGKWTTLAYLLLLTLPQFAFQSLSTWAQFPPAISNIGPCTNSRQQASRIRCAHLTEMDLLQSDWTRLRQDVCDGSLNAFSAYITPDLSDDFSSYCVQEIQPHILSTKVNDADTPSFTQAINGPHAEKWWDAMETELDILEGDLKAWSLVPREPWMNVLPSTWAFRLKRFSNGLAKKFKARFCIRGDKQIEGVDFFETWAPVVQWPTVRTLMILATKLELFTAQADITAAFVHAELDEGEEIYVHQAAGFKRGQDLVCKLNRSVYGLRQSPMNFFRYLSDHIRAEGLMPSELDPCLFVGPTVIAVIYVDDVLLYSKSNSEIDRVLANLKTAGISIRKEGTAEGFLGVDISRTMTPAGPVVTLLQQGLAKRIMEALGLCSGMSTALSTPAEATPLTKDIDGDPASGSFNYAAVIGMLLYLSRHSRPDIAFAVHQCARFTFSPTRRHELALLRVGRYLKGTMGQGLIMTPTSEARIDCYPDADFAGLYGHEDSQDPSCAKSRTGYIILAFNCPVMWRSRIQTLVAASTMEAEYVALSTACKDFFPVIDLVKALSGAVGLSKESTSNLNGKIFEDNVGALTLAKLEPARMTPRSKHFCIHYHWFRTRVSDPANNITLVKVDSRHQLGDIMTKGLTKDSFEHLRRLIMGW
jgi:hypothetical protein